MDFRDYCKQDSTFKDLDGKIEAKSAEQSSAIALAQGTSDKANIEKVASLNEEMKSLTTLRTARAGQLRPEWENKEADMEGALKTANGLRAGGSNLQDSNKTLTEKLMESELYKSIPDKTINGVSIPGLKNWKARRDPLHFEFNDENPLRAMKAMSMKANEITTTTAPMFYQPQGGIVPYAQYPATLFDVVPTFVATNKVVTYFRETSRTNAAAARAETVGLAQSTFALTREQDVAVVIGAYFKVTEEEMEDRADIIPYIMYKSNLELRIAAETSMLQGAGGTDLVGIYSQATGTYAKGTYTDTNGNPETDLDALGHAIQDLRTTGVCVPDLGVMHPNQFIPLRQTKNLIGDYIFGPPNTPMTDIYVFGVRFVQSLYAIDTQALLGDFGGYYSLGINQGINMDLTFSGDDPINLMRTARFWFRGLNQVRRPRAFETVTGLTSQV